MPFRLLRGMRLDVFDKGGAEDVRKIVALRVSLLLRREPYLLACAECPVLSALTHSATTGDCNQYVTPSGVVNGMELGSSVLLMLAVYSLPSISKVIIFYSLVRCLPC